MEIGSEIGRDSLRAASVSNDRAMVAVFVSHALMMHIAPTPRKCLMHEYPPYRSGMGASAERLKQARERAGFASAKAAAEAMGVPVATYVQHESGVRGYPASRAQRYAQFFRVRPEWLIYGSGKESEAIALGPQLYVKGEVAAGVWRDAWELPQDEWEAFVGRADVAVSLRQRFGLRVVGESMNEVYPPGTILECVQYEGQAIPNGKRVIVQRWRAGHGVETTVKEFHQADDGAIWLVPRSTNPAFQSPFRVDVPEPGVERIEVIGLVVASIRLE